ncbi:hypothetical protein [Actinokineospora sp. NBRC 105648]|uniref:hypothetical protein n=1 Tax=Actinokineospora sp. NBRC 105648 TaxID=3032206 RepID=UPI0024A56EDC|nr:hypothetical protein [Actinokineospora sp. NBRC 105648]GLZ39073.1 hypothetical protein Acsp05_26970 [Actinokineospora sp. NBRC 105648]
MTDQDAVRVLDIRADGEDSAFLDRLDRVTAHRLGLVDRVVVLDRTDALLGNHERFQRLVSLSHVHAVVCVAVGPIGGTGGLALRQSAAFSSGVTLWVGDEWGSRWAGGTDRPRPLTDGDPALPDLVTALRSPQVFDEVVDLVRQVPHQTVCPGLELVRSAVSDGELRFLRTAALADLVDHSTTERPWPGAPDPAVAGEPGRDTITPGSPLAQGREALHRAVDALAATAATASGATALLLGGPRVDPRPVAQALDAHLGQVGQLLDLLDRHGTGTDAVRRLHALGVPQAHAAANTVLADDLRELVGDELKGGRSLRDLSIHLRRLSNQSAPEGSGVARAELATIRAGLPPQLRSPTPPPLWPLPAAALAAAAAVSTAITGWLTGSPVAGGTIGLLWTVLVLTVVLRLPGRGSTGPAVRDVLAVGGVGAAAALGVAAATFLPGVVLPAVGGAVVLAAVAALTVAGVATAWHRLVTGWVARLRPDAVRHAVKRVDALVNARVTGHVRYLAHRRRLSDAALLLASGTAELADLYTLRAADGPQEPPAQRGGVGDLPGVLRQDLVSLVLRALNPYLHDIGTTAPLTTDPGLPKAADADLAEYHQFLETHSVHVVPPMVTDDGRRESLSKLLWQRSEAARRVLRHDGRGDLVQLCQTGDIRALDVTWSRVRVLRFAPDLVQRVVLGAAATADVLTTDADVTGVLRLVPLAPGRVVHEHPTHTDAGERGQP